MLWRWTSILLLGTAVAAQSVPQSPPASFRIAGTVVQALTGQPLPEVQLSIIRAQTPDVLQSVNADEGGHFVFDGIAPGKYVLQAQARGFPQQAWDEHFGFSTAVAVGPGKDSESVIFRMRPGASISGLVVDDANEPVRDAEVMLFHRGAEEGNDSIHLREQASTNDQGRYHFAHLFPGTYFLAASARPWYAQPALEGIGDHSRDVIYPVTYYSGTIDSNGATPVTVKPGDKIVADFSLGAIPGLRLELTDPGISDGGAALYATQKIFGEMSVGTSGQTERTSDGRVFLTGLPPGDVEVNSNSPGNSGRNWKQSIHLAGNSSLKIVPVPAPISVEGNVILGDTKFQSGSINLTDRSTGERSTTGLNRDGSFKFSDTPIHPGSYQINVYNLPGAILSSVAATGAKVDGRTIQIGNGAAVTLSLLMSKGVGRIDGTAIRDGKPFPGAMIVLLPQDLANDQSLIRRDQSDSDGTFTLAQISPGRYTVLALQDGWELNWQDPAVLKPFLKQGQLVLVGPNQRYEMKINVQ